MLSTEVPLGLTVVLDSVVRSVVDGAGAGAGVGAGETTVVLLSVSLPGVTTVVESPPAGGVCTSASHEASRQTAAAAANGRNFVFIGSRVEVRRRHFVGGSPLPGDIAPATGNGRLASKIRKVDGR